MRARHARRFRLIAIFILAFALAASGVWLNMALKKADKEAALLARTDPDYYMDNFRHFTLKLTGEADYTLTGKKWIHYPDNHSYLVKFPVMESLDNKKRLQITYADWAYAEDENSKIHMHENVVILRPPTPNTEAFRLTTDYLLFLPDENIMRTDREIVAYQGRAVMNGTGMEANNATRELFLLSRTKVVYPPRKPTK